MKSDSVLIFSIALISFILFSCKTEKNTPQPSEFNEIQQRIDSAAQDFMSKSNVVGASIAILSKTDTIYDKGFGFVDIDRSVPATNEYRFIMASISKLVGSAAVMKLVEEGKLSIDQSLSELIPELQLSKSARDITLQQMLSHTSGLPEYSKVIDTAYAETGIEPTREDIYKFLENRELLFEPGWNYSYCNTGFRLMAEIVERSSGESYQSEIDRLINIPGQLDLKLIRESATDSMMSPYFQIEKGKTVPYEHWLWIKGDGGLTGTALDLAHFPHRWSDGTLISEESFLNMTTPVLLNDSISTDYGLGVRNGEIAGRKIIGHTGGHNSPLSVMAYFPEEEISIVTFVNTDKTQSHVRKLFGAVVHAYFNQPRPDYKENSLKLDSAETLVGEYVSAVGEGIFITYESSKDALYYCISPDQCERMYRIHNNRYWLERWPYDFIEFIYDANSSVLGLKEYYSGYFFSLRKKKVDHE